MKKTLALLLALTLQNKQEIRTHFLLGMKNRKKHFLKAKNPQNLAVPRVLGGQYKTRTYDPTDYPHILTITVSC